MPLSVKGRIGVLVSGGLDSVCLIAHYLEQGFEVWPVYVRCGLRWERAETYWLNRFLRAMAQPRLRPLSTVELSLDEAYKKNWSRTGRVPGQKSPDSAVFLPARNLLLIVKSLLFLSSKNVRRVALGTLKGNPFKDGRASYFKLLEKVVSESFDEKIRIEFPFRHLDKTTLVRRYRNFPIDLSLSCIDPHGHKPCNRCNKCAERRRALAAV